MSLDLALARIAELNGALAPSSPAVPSGGLVAPASASFRATLAGALASPAAPAPSAMVALAQREVGQAEFPPGSNDSPRIAEYRTSTAGSVVAPWCGYFVSWLAQQAGVPIGDRGEGNGSVDAIWAWGERTGRAVPAAAGPPRPGDLIVWDEHIGIVESVLPDGGVQTIEGNSSNAVTRRVHAPGSAIGYVRLG